MGERKKDWGKEWKGVGKAEIEEMKVLVGHE